MTSIPVKTTTGNMVGLKLVPDNLGNFLPVINIENFEDFQGPQGPPGPPGLPGPQSPFIIIQKSNDYTLLTTEIGHVFTNSGPGTVILYLPVPVIGLHYHFIVRANEDSGFGGEGFGEADFGESEGGLRIVPDGSHTFSLGDIYTEDASAVFSNFPFAALHLVAISASEWIALSKTGTWDVEPAGFGAGGFGDGIF